MGSLNADIVAFNPNIGSPDYIIRNLTVNYTDGGAGILCAVGYRGTRTAGDVTYREYDGLMYVFIRNPVPGTEVMNHTSEYVSGNERGIDLPICDDLIRHDFGYTYSSSGSGTTTFASNACDYEFPNNAAFVDAMRNHEITPPATTVYFDVYINGTDQPSIFVNWTAGEELSPVIATPRIWKCVEGTTLFPEFVTSEQTGLLVPNSAQQWRIEPPNDYSYAGSLTTTYIEIYSEFEKYLNPTSKVLNWGFDGIPDVLGFYLQMNYEDKYGELFRVSIQKDGTPLATKIEGTSNANYTTFVRFHTGEPDYVLPDDDTGYPHGTNDDGTDDGRYNPDQSQADRDFSDGDGQGFDGDAVLTKTYAVSAATLQNVGQKLWSQSYFDVLKIQSNPIENIVSVKWFPYEFTGGTSEQIQVGDIAFGVNGDKIDRVQTKDIGHITYTGKFGNYLDLSPFTVCKLNLPYIGMIQLDPNELFNCKLACTYVVDTVTGQCMAKLTLDGVPYMNVVGQMGIDIPLTATDRVQSELRTASSAFNVGNAAAGQIISGNAVGGLGSAVSGALNIAGADYASQRTSSPSPACASFENHYVFLLIERPLEDLAQVESEGYKHLHGYPCHKYLTLSQLAIGNKKGGGFVQVDARTDINIGMTSEENALLEQLLKTGVYVKPLR